MIARSIGEKADIRGEIKVKSITVYGKVQGNIIVSERCELKSTCTLHGDLKAPRLVVEEGATFIGKSEPTNDTQAGKFDRARSEIVQHEEPSGSARRQAGAVT